MTDAELAAIAVESYSAPPDITGFGPFKGTHAIVREREGITIVAFRGTDDPSDWVVDLMAIPQLSYYKLSLFHPVFIHRGFLLSAVSVLSGVLKAVQDRKYILTGHSLGGAIALITGYHLKHAGHPPEEIVTFGAPKAGFTNFANSFVDTPVRQYRRGNDPVSSVPMATLLFPYVHVRAPLIGVGEPDEGNPFSSHRMAGYAADVLAYLGMPKAELSYGQQ